MLRVSRPTFKPVNKLICCKTGYTLVVKRQHRYSTRFAAMLQDKFRVFCCPFFRTLRMNGIKELNPIISATCNLTTRVLTDRLSRETCPKQSVGARAV